MKHLEYYIIEKLSKEQIDKLDNLIGDRDFDDAFKSLNHYFKKKDTLLYSASRKEIINSINKLSKSTKKEKTRIEKIKNILDSIKPLKQNTRYNLIKKLEDKILDIYGEETWKTILTYLTLEGHDSNKHNELSDFLDEHGLNRDYIKWGMYDPEEVFLDIFKDSDKLQNLLDGKYEKTIDDLTNTDNNGKNFIETFCSDFSDEAKKLLQINYVKSNGTGSNVGCGEILLKCILKGGTSGNKGDVIVKEHNKNIIKIEVKTGAINNSGRPTGQDNINPKSFKETIDKKIYHFFKKYYGSKDKFYEIQNSILNSEKKLSTLKPTSKNKYIGFFQTQECEILLQKLLKNDDKLINKFIDVLAEGVQEQYGEEKVNIPKDVILSVKDNFDKDNKIKFIDIIGFFETYCYKILTELDYLFIIDDNTSKYVIFSKDELNNINNLLKYIHFGYVSSGNGREAAAKYKLK